jgi:hypothetical protein
MSLCSVCGIQLGGDASLCTHHDVPAHGWAAENRIMCDLLHRGIVPPRLPPRARCDDVVMAADAA